MGGREAGRQAERERERGGGGQVLAEEYKKEMKSTENKHMPLLWFLCVSAARILRALELVPFLVGDACYSPSKLQVLGYLPVGENPFRLYALAPVGKLRIKKKNLQTLKGRFFKRGLF